MLQSPPVRRVFVSQKAQVATPEGGTVSEKRCRYFFRNWSSYQIFTQSRFMQGTWTSGSEHFLRLFGTHENKLVVAWDTALLLGNFSDRDNMLLRNDDKHLMAYHSLVFVEKGHVIPDILVWVILYMRRKMMARVIIVGCIWCAMDKPSLDNDATSYASMFSGVTTIMMVNIYVFIIDESISGVEEAILMAVVEEMSARVDYTLSL
ncbi:hypothetical protein Tco_0233446 [Tanacetum coccineum]